MKTKSCNILIVEDEFINAKFVEDTLISLGHKVASICASADEAIQLAKNDKIDLAFMDINIEGGTDGIMCATLLNQHYCIPIIYMTAYNDTNTIEEASDTNIYGYLIKPFDKKDIEASLNVAIKISLKSKIEPQIKIAPKNINLGHNYIYTFKTKTLKIDNIYIKLTKKESLILHLFCLNINQNISYALLLEYIWKNKDVADSTIRDVIFRLRKKAPLLDIENISKLGYCLNHKEKR